MVVGDDAQVDLFVVALELGHLGQQPQRGHRRAGGHRHLLRTTPVADLAGGLRHLHERVAHGVVVLAAGRAQVDRPGGALEQGLAQVILEQTHLTADRPLGDVQFLGGQGKAQMSRSGFECHQAVERRQWMDFHAGKVTQCCSYVRAV
ncbi:hypothetical protein D3C80_1526230 [compost metagenome]